MPYETILTSTEGPIGLITLNRPKALNALNTQLMNEIGAALAAFDADEAIRCIVITGAGERAFCAGADIREMGRRGPIDMLKEFRSPLWDIVRTLGKPVIAAVNGFALGGGCELAMCCDIILAADTARFGQPEINLGIIPGAGGTQRLPRAIGKYRAMEWVLTGNQFTAQEAFQAGLVNRVVPAASLLDEAKKLALEIAARPPIAVKMAKQAVARAQDLTLENGLDYERQCFFLLFATEDQKEGMKAFQEKRKPEWKGR